MNTKTVRIITAAAISFALAIPVTAFACGGKDGSAHEGRFEKADKNHDGFLTQAEVGPQHWDHIKIADVNNDSKVSKEEMKQAFEGTGRGDRFQRADKNHDGFLTQAEVGPQRWERIKVADANNDGKVSKDEMMQAFKAGKLGRRHEHKSAA
jgi:hypothetical protein